MRSRAERDRRLDPALAHAAAPVIVVAALALPPAREWLEATMLRHMLVQLPLIALCGFVLGRALLDLRVDRGGGRVVAALQRCNRYGATGLIAASFAMLLWMLPRALDAARLDPGVDALKFASIFVLAGIAVAWSWPQCPALLRAVVHVEVVATLIRFGWAYLAADERLCASYLLEDQRSLGAALVVLGILWAAAAAWRPLFGAPRSLAKHEPSNAS